LLYTVVCVYIMVIFSQGNSYLHAVHCN